MGPCYTAGAIVFGRQRPDPRPGVFGYHEISHTLVLAGADAHDATVAFLVLPRG